MLTPQTYLDDLKPQILQLIFQHVRPENCIVFLLGSFAKGIASQASDLDIGLFSEPPLSMQQWLYLKRELNEQVRTLRSIDLVNFNSTDDTFKELALEHGIIWHQSKKLKMPSSFTKKH